MNRVRAALLRLSPPWRRRHPVVLATVERVTIRGPRDFGLQTIGDIGSLPHDLRVQIEAIDATYAAERDPSDEAGA